MTPLAVSYIITPVPSPSPWFDDSENCVDSTYKLFISLYSIDEMHRPEKLNQVIRSITNQYFSLSWLTASPSWPNRKSVLPLHFAMAEKLSKSLCHFQTSDCN